MNELDENSIIRKILITAKIDENYQTRFYNLDAIMTNWAVKKYLQQRRTEFTNERKRTPGEWRGFGGFLA